MLARRARFIWTLAGTVALALIAVGLVSAQRNFRFRYEKGGANARYDGRFTFARLKYDCVNGFGFSCYYYRSQPSWAHGYSSTDNGLPAEHELMQILDAISAVHPRVDDSNVFALDDPELFKFPVAYMTEAGFWQLSDREAAAFRSYLLKGGFVIFDDFRPPPRGGGGWGQFVDNMHRVLPDAKIVELDPGHPIFHSFFDINSFDIIPQSYDYNRPVISGIFENNESSKRLMAVINFNTDISDFWEYSGTGLMPVAESNEAFKLGVNYIIYGLTH